MSPWVGTAPTRGSGSAARDACRISQPITDLLGFWRAKADVEVQGFPPVPARLCVVTARVVTAGETVVRAGLLVRVEHASANHEAFDTVESDWHQ